MNDGLPGKFHFGPNSSGRGVYSQNTLLLIWAFFSLRKFCLWQVVLHNDDLLFFLVRLLWLDVINLIITLIRNSFHLIICPTCVWGFIGHKLCWLIPQTHEQEALASLESFLAKSFLGKSSTVFKCSKKSKEAVNWGTWLKGASLAMWRLIALINVNLINCALRMFPPVSILPQSLGIVDLFIAFEGYMWRDFKINSISR